MEISFMSLQIKFHVVPDIFKIREEGILGNYFFGRYSAIINYKTGQVQFQISNRARKFKS